MVNSVGFYMLWFCHHTCNESPKNRTKWDDREKKVLIVKPFWQINQQGGSHTRKMVQTLAHGSNYEV